MDGMKKVYHLLHNELERIENKDFDVQTIYTLDEKTGEYIPIAEGMPEEAEELVQSIKKNNSKTINFVMQWQRAQLNATKVLNGNSLRILQMLVGKMKFDNCVYGITQLEVSTFLNMSPRTVIRSISELRKNGFIIITGKKGNRVYHVNPAYTWKGSFMRMGQKLKMFRKSIKDKEDLWERPTE